MKRILFVALAVTVVAFFGFVAVFAQSAGRFPVEGVWEVRDVTFAKPPAIHAQGSRSR
jgi:hypothetical protein